VIAVIEEGETKLHLVDSRDWQTITKYTLSNWKLQGL
jgi:hypothetical protein